MNIQEGINLALRGDAILFAGAGFSVGAQNLKQESFKRSNELCILLCSEIGIEYEDDLQWVSERYLEDKGSNKLIYLLQQEYNARQVSKDHEQLMEVNWKRIYTTNYDNIVEKASDNIGKVKISITLGKKPFHYINKNDLVVHLNGYIKDLTFEKLKSEFKLTRQSYLTDDFMKSEWLTLFREDIRNAKAIFFVGYSLNYDLDIQRVLVSNDELREKCFFITHQKSSFKSQNVMGKFGQIETCGLVGFAEMVKNNQKNFSPIEKVDYNFSCFKYYTKEYYNIKEIKDKHITDLFIKGDINPNHVKFSSEERKYFVHRKEQSRIVKELDCGINLALITSDLGNGKTGLVSYLISVLVDKGHVFLLDDVTDSFSDELEIISKRYDGKKYIVIEDYNLYIKKIGIIKLYKSDDFRFIFTARSLINDVFYSRVVNALEIDEDKVGIYDLDFLDNDEIKELIGIFDCYSLWGAEAAISYADKMKLLRKEYKARFQNILIGTMQSEYIKLEINNILETIKLDKKIEEIVLTSLINEIMSLKLRLDEIIYLLGDVLISAKVLRNPVIGELIDFKGNRIKVKSSILANFIIKSNDLSYKLVDILVRIMTNADKMTLNDKYYQTMKMLVSFSNIRLLLNSNHKTFVKLLIRYYEDIKNLDFSKENPFFWLQYAIARLELGHFEPAEICFANAYAFGKKKFDIFDSFQLDTHYSRFMLEKHMHDGSPTEAFNIFENAHKLLTGSRQKEAGKLHLHYELRQTILYYPYYKKFFNNFEEAEKVKFLMYCWEIKQQIEKYFIATKRLNRRTHPVVEDAFKGIKSIIEDIRIKQISV